MEFINCELKNDTYTVGDTQGEKFPFLIGGGDQTTVEEFYTKSKKLKKK